MTTYLSSLQSGLREAFNLNEKVFLLGEDVVDPYGGAFKVTKGLSSVFPDRVMTTPISEAGFTGIGVGMALRGLRPVVEIMFGDFITLCADQIVNHMAKFKGMYNDQVDVPIVIRTPMGGGRGYGATHSQSLEKLFLGVPGIRVVSPSHVHDPGLLLKQAILNENCPVLFIEHKLLYPLPLVAENSGKLVLQLVREIDGWPTMLVRNYSDGEPDVTLISYGGTSREIIPLMERMQEEEINILAAFPSSLKPVPVETLVEAAARSGKVIIAEEGTSGFNWGSEIAALIYERLFSKLQRPIHRIASEDKVIPVASNLEKECLINVAKIERAILEVLS